MLTPALNNKQIFTNEIHSPEFSELSRENYSELFLHIATGNLNIRIHRDITGEIGRWRKLIY